MASPDYRYTTAGFTNPSVQPGLERKFLGLMPPPAVGRRMCDLGCGNGQLVPHGRFHHAEVGEGLPRALLDSEGPFDVVVSSDVIEHLYRPGVLVDVAREILRPSGRLIVGTPYHGYLKNLAISAFGKWDSHHTVDRDGGHIKFFSVATLRTLVEKRGFEETHFHFYWRAPFVWKNMICTARKPAASR